MKKLYLLLIAICFATAIFAQSNKKIANIESKKVKTNKEFVILNPNNVIKNSLNKQGMITDQPAGTVFKNQYRSSNSFFVSMGGVYKGYVDGFISTYIKDDNGNVYIKDPIALLPSDTWLKAEKATGDTLIARANQFVYEEEGDGINYKLYVSRMVEQRDEEGYLTYVFDENDKDIKFILRNDSLIHVNGGLIALHSDQGEWAGFGDLNTVICKNNDPITTVDASINFEDYAMSFKSTSEITDGQLVKLAIKNNNVYIKGFAPNTPNAVACGQINGNKVIFPSKQYLGLDEITQYHTYFCGGRITVIHDDEYDFDMDSLYIIDNLTFDYDATNKTLKSKDVLIVNGGKKYAMFTAMYKEPEFAKYVEVANTPKAPVVTDFSLFDNEYGYSTLSFELPKHDINDNFMNINKVYYKIYKADGALSFSPEQYSGLTETITEIPYLLDNSDNITTYDTSHTILIYEDINKIGVQSIYKGGNETHESEITWFLIGEDNSIDNLVNNKVLSTHYVNLIGQHTQKPVKGIYIKIDNMSDGTQKATKVLF